MNERLEKEWKSYCAKHGSGIMISVNVKDVAQHFYNLALEDVRKELKPEKDISYPDDYERGSVDGRNELREELLDFINQLSK